MITLFPDQIELVNDLRKSMTRNKRILLQSATGSGKSVLASSMIASSQSKGKKAAFVVPRIDLIKQMSLTFQEFNIPHGYVAARMPMNPFSKTHICSAMTLVNRLDSIEPDVLFVDEAHISGASVRKILDHYHSKGAWVIGLTASPIKTSGEPMSSMYDALVCGKSIKWLIENKRLSDYKLYAPSSPDLSGVTLVAGEYNKKILSAEMMRQSQVTGDAVTHYKKLAYGKKAVAYCCSIEHSKQTRDAFNRSGIRAEHIDGETPMDERREICLRFARGYTDVLCSVDLITTGFDLKSQTGIDVCIEAVIVLRPTKSLALWLQMIGRGLRYKDYPAIILDHAGNALQHGMPCADREWTLDGNAKKSNKTKTPPTRQCPACFMVHSPAPVCPECSHVYQVKSREIDEVEGDLQEITRDTEIILKKKEQGMAQSLEQLIRVGRARGFSHPEKWAAHILSARMRKGKR